jgi:hypothetical protein
VFPAFVALNCSYPDYTPYRLKAKLKVARPRNDQQDNEQRTAFKQTLPTTSI